MAAFKLKPYQQSRVDRANSFRDPAVRDATLHFLSVVHRAENGAFESYSSTAKGVVELLVATEHLGEEIDKLATNPAESQQLGAQLQTVFQSLSDSKTSLPLVKDVISTIGGALSKAAGEYFDSEDFQEGRYAEGSAYAGTRLLSDVVAIPELLATALKSSATVAKSAGIFQDAKNFGTAGGLGENIAGITRAERQAAKAFEEAGEHYDKTLAAYEAANSRAKELSTALKQTTANLLHSNPQMFKDAELDLTKITDVAELWRANFAKQQLAQLDGQIEEITLAAAAAHELSEKVAERFGEFVAHGQELVAIRLKAAGIDIAADAFLHTVDPKAEAKDNESEGSPQPATGPLQGHAEVSRTVPGRTSAPAVPHQHGPSTPHSAGIGKAVSGGNQEHASDTTDSASGPEPNERPAEPDQTHEDRPALPLDSAPDLPLIPGDLAASTGSRLTDDLGITIADSMAPGPPSETTVAGAGSDSALDPVPLRDSSAAAVEAPAVVPSGDRSAEAEAVVPGTAMPADPGPVPGVSPANDAPADVGADTAPDVETVVSGTVLPSDSAAASALEADGHAAADAGAGDTSPGDENGMTSTIPPADRGVAPEVSAADGEASDGADGGPDVEAAVSGTVLPADPAALTDEAPAGASSPDVETVVSEAVLPADSVAVPAAQADGEASDAADSIPEVETAETGTLLPGDSAAGPAAALDEVPAGESSPDVETAVTGTLLPGDPAAAPASAPADEAPVDARSSDVETVVSGTVLPADPAALADEAPADASPDAETAVTGTVLPGDPAAVPAPALADEVPVTDGIPEVETSVSGTVLATDPAAAAPEVPTAGEAPADASSPDVETAVSGTVLPADPGPAPVATADGVVQAGESSQDVETAHTGSGFVDDQGNTFSDDDAGAQDIRVDAMTGDPYAVDRKTGDAASVQSVGTDGYGNVLYDAPAAAGGGEFTVGQGGTLSFAQESGPIDTSGWGSAATDGASSGDNSWQETSAEVASASGYEASTTDDVSPSDGSPGTTNGSSGGVTDSGVVGDATGSGDGTGGDATGGGEGTVDTSDGSGGSSDGSAEMSPDTGVDTSGGYSDAPIDSGGGGYSEGVGLGSSEGSAPPAETSSSGGEDG